MSVSSSDASTARARVADADALPGTAGYLFAPLDKRALGVAIGVAFAACVAGLTAINIVQGLPWPGLILLREYFAGYSVSWGGAAIGAAWGFAVGFVAGWMLAFVRNVTLAVSLFLLHAKAELGESTDFLDHI